VSTRTILIVRRDGSHRHHEVAGGDNHTVQLAQGLKAMFDHAKVHGEPKYAPVKAIMVLGTEVYEYSADDCREIASLKALTGAP
jgi:hypothetical protein